MADAIVSVVLKQLATVVGQEVKLVVGVDDEVKKLTSNFQTIQDVLADAEQREDREPAVRVWLEKLKDVSYDMDDVLDEWNTAILRRLHIQGNVSYDMDDVLDERNNARTLKSKLCFSFLFPCFVSRRVVLRHSIAFKIKAINESIDVIAKEKDEYKFKLTRSMEQPQRVESTSFIDVSEVFGRDEQMKSLVSKLSHKSCEEQNRLHIISIVGMGGIGKTTLAQLVYNTDEVIKEFEKRIWVCVSYPFNVFRIAKAILENLKGRASNLSTLQSLLEKISESLRNKKFLIVLDDVWTEDYRDWEPFHHCLKNGLYGSKVLITTRKEVTAHTMKSIDIIPIEELSKEQCWSLFRWSVFFGRSKEECEKLEEIGGKIVFCGRSEEEWEKLEEIGRKIVSKCKGLPLAVKAMGSLLRIKRSDEWENVLNSEVWKLEGLENEVLAPLLLSYYDLPSMVKRCFTYCAVFPKNFVFEKDDLIKLWMAQGYLGLNQNEEIEITGENYFNILAMRSFFQEFEKDDDGRIISCKMHDIVHDVAQFLSKDECCKVGVDGLIEGNINALCEKARHCWLSEISSTHSISICNFKKLRSLFIDDIINDGNKSIDEVLGNLFDELTCLKSFKIRNSRRDIEIIPKEIGKLIHLRYLDLSENEDLTKLPETLCELYNLQTLNLDYCDGLEELPQGIRKLINLRYLMNEGCDSLTSVPKGFERLTRLRTISEFPLGGGEACSLANFHHLKRLGLCCFSLDSKKDEAILETFQPPPNLQWLSIKYYRGGTMSTIWMESLTNLRFLNLIDCENCLHLPPLGKLQSLETLSIESMKSVRSVGKEFLGIESDESSSSSSFISFPKLKTLQFVDMEDWEVWDFGVEDHTTIMPSLRSLEISYCYKLKGLPKQLLQTAPLENLSIRACNILKQLYEEGMGENWPDISHIPNIQVLETDPLWRILHILVESEHQKRSSTASEISPITQSKEEQAKRQTGSKQEAGDPKGSRDPSN